MNKNNSNSKNRELAYNGIGSGGGGGGKSFDVKSFTYTGNGENVTVIEFPDVPKYVFNMYGTTSTGARVSYIPFVFRESDDVQAVMNYDRGGTGSQFGTFKMYGKTLEISGMSDVGARLNQEGMVSTIFYI